MQVWKHPGKGAGQSPTGWCTRNAGNTVVAHPTMVPTTPGIGDRTPTSTEAREASPPTTREAGCVAPPSFETVSLGDSYIRAALQGTGLSSTATTLICNAWREGTQKQYDGTL